MSINNNPPAAPISTPPGSTSTPPTNNNPSTNTENFNAMMRRTGKRLTGGLVTPPDSKIIAPMPLIVTQQGRGRGQGFHNAAPSTRSNVNTAVAPVVTLTVHG